MAQQQQFRSFALSPAPPPSGRRSSTPSRSHSRSAHRRTPSNPPGVTSTPFFGPAPQQQAVPPSRPRQHPHAFGLPGQQQLFEHQLQHSQPAVPPLRSPEPIVSPLASPTLVEPIVSPLASPTLVGSGERTSFGSSFPGSAGTERSFGEAGKASKGWRNPRGSKPRPMDASNFVPSPTSPAPEVFVVGGGDGGKTFASSTEAGDSDLGSDQSRGRRSRSGSLRSPASTASSSSSSQKARRAVAADRSALQSLLLDPRDDGGAATPTNVPERPSSPKERHRRMTLDRLQQDYAVRTSPVVTQQVHAHATRSPFQRPQGASMSDSVILDPRWGELSAGMDGSTVVLPGHGARTPRVQSLQTPSGSSTGSSSTNLSNRDVMDQPMTGVARSKIPVAVERGRSDEEGERRTTARLSMPISVVESSPTEGLSPGRSLDLGLAFRPEEVEAITRTHSRSGAKTRPPQATQFPEVALSQPSPFTQTASPSSGSGGPMRMTPPDFLGRTHSTTSTPPFSGSDSLPDRQQFNRTARPLSQTSFPAQLPPSQPSSDPTASIVSSRPPSSAEGFSAASSGSSSRRMPRGESPPFSPTTPAPIEPPPSGVRTMPAILRNEHDPPPLTSRDPMHIDDVPPSPRDGSQLQSPRRTLRSRPPLEETHSAPPPVLHRQESTIGRDPRGVPVSQGPTPQPRVGRSVSSPGPNPPPVSIPPTIRRPSQGGHPKDLEAMERLEWAKQTGRTDALAMRVNDSGPATGEGARDRWGNRWGMEGHVLSPVISERTEPSHTSESGSSSQASVSTATSRSRHSVVSNASLLRRLHHQSLDAAMKGAAPATAHIFQPALTERPHYPRRKSSSPSPVGLQSQSPMPQMARPDAPSRASSMSGHLPGHYPSGSDSTPPGSAPAGASGASSYHTPLSHTPPSRPSSGRLHRDVRHEPPARSTTAQPGTPLRNRFAQSTAIATSQILQTPPESDTSDQEGQPTSLMARVAAMSDGHRPEPDHSHPLGVRERYDADVRRARKDEKHRRRKERARRQSDAQKRDADVADRQAAKRTEKERREKMLIARDGILQQLADRPGDPKLIRDLGKLYLMNGSNESTLKLAVRYLEQSIQIDNRDAQAWLFLARAWNLLLTNHPFVSDGDRDQRASNASIGYRKAISIASQPKRADGNQYRLAYAEYLEEQNRFKEAAGILQEAIDADNGDAEVWWELGRIMEMWALKGDDVIHERVVRLRTSCQAYKAACDIDPTDDIMREGLDEARASLQRMELEASPAQGKAASRTVSPSVPGSAVTTKETQRVSPMQAPVAELDRQMTPRPSPAGSAHSSARSKSGSSKSLSGRPPSPSQLRSPGTKALVSPANTRSHTPSSTTWRPPSPSSLPPPSSTPRIVSPAANGPPPPAIPPRPQSRAFPSSTFSSSSSSPTTAFHPSGPGSPIAHRLGPPHGSTISQQQSPDADADADIDEEYAFSRLNEHLQSLIEIDNQRRTEIAALRQQFDDTDKEADRRRAEVFEHIRSICATPAAGRPPSRSQGRPQSRTAARPPSRSTAQPESSRAPSRSGRSRTTSNPPMAPGGPPPRHAGVPSMQRSSGDVVLDQAMLGARPFSAMPPPVLGQDQAGFALNGIASIIHLLQTSGPSPAPHASAPSSQQR